MSSDLDHVMMVAVDDPELKRLKDLTDIANVKILPNVGCEAFAEFVYSHWANKIDRETQGRVRLVSVECFEHGSNSATYGWRV